MSSLHLSDSHALHEKGYSSRAVHACWILEAYAALHGLLTDQGVPLEDEQTIDSSFYLSTDEWREVAEAARTIADLAPIIAAKRETGEE